jgi:hypothetical protein
MHKKSRIQSAIALLIGAALLVPVASIAQDQTIDPTDVQEASRECGSGYKRVGPIRTGYLAKGGTLVLGYNLTPGRKYCFVAVGDEQAIDVDWNYWIVISAHSSHPSQTGGRIQSLLLLISLQSDAGCIMHKLRCSNVQLTNVNMH